MCIPEKKERDRAAARKIGIKVITTTKIVKIPPHKFSVPSSILPSHLRFMYIYKTIIFGYRQSWFWRIYRRLGHQAHYIRQYIFFVFIIWQCVCTRWSFLRFCPIPSIRGMLSIAFKYRMEHRHFFNNLLVNKLHGLFSYSLGGLLFLSYCLWVYEFYQFSYFFPFGIFRNSSRSAVGVYCYASFYSFQIVYGKLCRLSYRLPADYHRWTRSYQTSTPVWKLLSFGIAK